jgi:hypothetical protein
MAARRLGFAHRVDVAPATYERDPMSIAPAEITASREDMDGVIRAALDYIEGFLQRDPERHGRAYHPECIKRRFVTDDDSGVDELQVLSPRIMVDYASSGRSIISDCEVEVVIDDISEGIASVRVYSCHWVDFLHVVKA